MPQVIVIEGIERNASTKILFDSLLAAGIEDALLIAKTMPKGTVKKENFISSAKGILAKAFLKTLNKTKSDQLLIINSESGLTERQLRNICTQAIRPGANQEGYALVKTDGAAIDFPGNKAAELIPFLTANKPVPSLCVLTGKKTAARACALGAESAVELAAQIVFLALAEKAVVTKLNEQIKISAEALLLQPLQLTGPECARTVRGVIETCPIEELFPVHPWDKYKEESLAACYHTITALFVRLGDFDTAKETLVQADQLEDSPRSLALRGVISARKGDWLDACANLIAGLQQYEVRMRATDDHYIKFSPKDLQKINSALLAGLDSLNHKNNKAASNQFAEAIFLYDSFFFENGIASLKVV